MSLEKIRQNLSVINIMCRTLYFEMLTLLSFDDCRNGGGEANRACLLLGQIFNMMWMVIRMIPRREQQHRTVLAPDVKANVQEKDDAGNQTEKSKEATRNITRLVEGYGSGISVNQKRQKLMEKKCNDLLDSRDKKKFATEQATLKAKKKDDENSNKAKRNSDTGKADSNRTKSPDAKRAKRGSKESSPNNSSDLFSDCINGGGNKNKTLNTNQTKRSKSVSATSTSKSSETRAKEPSNSAAVKPNSTKATSTTTSTRTEASTSDTTPTKGKEPRNAKGADEQQ